MLRSDLTIMERALQALVLSQYRLKVFQDHRFSIKPVVFFKAAKIADSKDFMAEFKEKFLLQLKTEAVPATIFVYDNDYKIWGLHFFNQVNRMKESTRSLQC